MLQSANMAAHTAPASDQPFRFLDLPVDIRCCVYEHIEIPTTWHVLDRTQAQIKKPDWPVPPKTQIYDSRITLIQPHPESATNLLATCRLVHTEARPFLRRRIQRAGPQSVRYLVDYSAVFALVKPHSVLRSCLGMPGARTSRENTAVQSFLRVCALALSRTRPPPSQTTDAAHSGARGVRAIEMTITHRRAAVHGPEVIDAVLRLAELPYYTPTRVVVVYQTPLPRIAVPGGVQAAGSGFLEDRLRRVPREADIGKPGSPEWGVLVRPLGEAEFERHVEGLDSC